MARVKPIPLGDLKQLPYTLQEWIREVANLLYASSGLIPVTSGGTGIGSYAVGDLLYASATTTLSKLAIGTAGKMLQSIGGLPAWSTPTWPTAAPGAGTFPRGDGTNFVTSTLTLPDTLTANQVLYGTGTNAVGGSANLSFDGTTQAITGNQTISGTLQVPVWKPGANSTTALKATKADGTTAVLTVDTTNSRLGINITPSYALDISGGQAAFKFASSTHLDAVIQSGTGSTQSYIVFAQGTYAGGTARFYFGIDAAGKGTFGTYNNRDIQFKNTAGSNLLYLKDSGAVGVGTASPTAVLHLKAGTATASTAPLKFTTGTSLTAAEAGAVEFTTDDLFFTITTGTARKRLLMADPVGGLTSGRVPYAITNGRLTDVSGFEFDGSWLTAPTRLKTGTYTNADATPTVAGVNRLVITNSGATTITDFDDGVAGQVIVLQFADANTTVNRTSCYLAGGANFTSSGNDTLVLVQNDAGLWEEISRSANS